MNSFIYLSSFIASVHAFGCLSDTGREVDWWVILKMPQIKASFPYGDTYYYCDSANDCSQLSLSKKSIGDKDSALLATIASFAANPIMLTWNDQKYDGKTLSTRAHSKGFMSSDGTAAVLINHSVPKLPALNDDGEILIEYPSNGYTYGQHMFCMTTDLDQLEQIASAHIKAEVNVFASRFPTALSNQYPTLHQLSQQKYMKNSKIIPLLNDVYRFTTRGGLQISVFAKSPKDLVEFYSDVVSEDLQVGLVAETWGNGAGGLEEPICTSARESISNMETVIDGVVYSYTKDHSKYAISNIASSPYVCFSDINRQVSQHKRGGTAYCILNASLWNIIHNNMSRQQTC